MKKICKFFKNERGLALVSVLIISAVLALVSGSYLTTSTQEAGLVTEDIQETQALYAAESGIQYAYRQLSSVSGWEDSSSWIGDHPDGLGGTVTIAFAYDDTDSNGKVNSADIGTITSTSLFQGNTKTVVARIIPMPSTNPFNNATCGCNGVDFSGNSAAVVGSVASNGDIDLGGATVNGDIVAVGDLYGKPGVTASGSATLGGANVNGLTQGAGGNVVGGISVGQDVDPPCDCDAMNIAGEVDEAQASNNNGAIYSACPSCMNGTSIADPGTEFAISSGDVEFPAGSYYFTKFSISGNATITIPADAQVLIFLEGGGPFSFGGTGIVNTDAEADDFRVYSSSSTDIDLAGTSEFVGAIYAPDAQIAMKGTAQVTGALIGDVALMSGAVSFSYDPSLAAADEPGDVDPHVTLQPTLWDAQN